MINTYNIALAQILKDEGGYSDNSKDPGGPTNWGITIHDAQAYWKANATAEDVKNMPMLVAEAIYRSHYADPINYDKLPAGVDYALLDYAVNSGVSHAVDVIQKIVGVHVDGILGSATLYAINHFDSVKLINALYDQRLQFLQSLATWSTFGKGWTDRCDRGRALALSLVNLKPHTPVKIPNFWESVGNLFTLIFKGNK